MLDDDDDQFTFNETQIGSVSAETEVAASTVVDSSEVTSRPEDGPIPISDARATTAAGGNEDEENDDGYRMPPRPERTFTDRYRLLGRGASTGTSGNSLPVPGSETRPNSSSLALGGKRIALAKEE